MTIPVTEMFTQLPQASNANMNDIIAAVQGYLNPSTLGSLNQETLQQVFDLFQSNIVIAYPGNPNGHVAGKTYQLLWDNVDGILWVNTLSGDASTAVWKQSPSGSGVQSWTPIFTFIHPGDLSVVYTKQYGSYSYVGNLITATFELQFIPTYTTSNGYMLINGLPIANNAAIGNYPIGSVVTSDILFPSGTTNITTGMRPGESSIELTCSGSGIPLSLVFQVQFISGNAVQIFGTISYFI